MGSENSKFLSEQELPHQYRPLKQLYGVYESIINGTRIQKHKLELNNEAEINYEKDIFIFRRMNTERIISAYYFQKFIPSHFCNMSYQVCFFTQYPSYIMSLDLVLTTQQGFNLLIECLKGFQLLFNKFGSFSITSKNIFFNSHHQPKVWISPDLGRTTVEKTPNNQISQQKMIIDLFRLFDQIKDQRNSTIIFSNYLKRLQSISNTELTFKGVINYLVDEASKFFIHRTKNNQRDNQLYENKSNMQLLKQSTNNPSIVSHLGFTSLKQKQKNPNVISLKTRNTSKGSNTNSSGGFTKITSPTNGFSLTNGQKQQNWIEKAKKSKRHNSQEDCPCPSREAYFFKQAPRHHYGQGAYRTQTQNIYQNAKPCSIFQEIKNVEQLNHNTMRAFRKSMDQLQKVPFVQNNEKEQIKTKRNKNQKPKQFLTNDFANIEAQLQKNKRETAKKVVKIDKVEPNVKRKPSTKFQYTSPSAVQFHAHTDNFLTLISPIKQNENNMILSNLQTLKSIIHSQYSDLDSQIRDDLENIKL